MVIVTCFGCGKVAAVKHDAGVVMDAPPSSHACVFDSDKFDNGCTLAP